MIGLLADADLIYVIGSKRAFPVTTYISLTLSQQGVRNVLVDNVGSTALDQVGCIGKADAVLAVSFSPYNSITPDLVAVARERNAEDRRDHRQHVQPAGQAVGHLDRGGRIRFRRLPLARRVAGRRHGAGARRRRSPRHRGAGRLTAGKSRSISRKIEKNSGELWWRLGSTARRCWPALAARLAYEPRVRPVGDARSVTARPPAQDRAAARLRPGGA